MTTGDIQAHRLEIYGTEIGRETISKIGDHRQPRMTIAARDTTHRTVPTAELTGWKMPRSRQLGALALPSARRGPVAFRRFLLSIRAAVSEQVYGL